MRAIEIDGEQAVLQFSAKHAHAVGEQECLLELAGSDAAMQEMPPFVRFGLRGPYVDDSDADYGFWPDWDALDPGLEWPLIGKYQLEECIIDRHNETTVSVYDLNRNLLWETTNETLRREVT